MVKTRRGSSSKALAVSKVRPPQSPVASVLTSLPLCVSFDDLCWSYHQDQGSKEMLAPAPVPSPLSSKGKGKKPVTNPTSFPRMKGVNFKTHSPLFCYKDNARDMVIYAQRKFLVERNYILSDHRPYGVLNILQERKWADEEESEPLDKDEVFSEIVGQKMVATTNWKMTSHTATISFDMASFLYKASAPILDTVEASSLKKSKPQSLVFASDDLPAEAPVPTALASVSAELSGVRASLNSLTDRVMTFEGL
uniref:Uncharacterized protein n=1 Tax=Cannabis sativa TaxID=3483 RepID=A0A803P962_CANSA